MVVAIDGGMRVFPYMGARNSMVDDLEGWHDIVLAVASWKIGFEDLRV
jgi:hypothetical protein